MKLIGMLDSPYVRRVAICLDVLGIPFEHEAVSVFRDMDRFRAINPVVKTPTLVCDDGGILMDSGLILQYLEATHNPQGSPLWSRDPRLLLLQFRAVAFATAAVDKAAQFIYEKQLRPVSAQYGPWLERVHEQFTAAYAQLEQLLATEPALIEGAPTHASIWAAVAWQVSLTLMPGEVPAGPHPQLSQLSRQLEATALFQRWPPEGPGVPSGAV